MSFSINDFTSNHFPTDLYRANLFQVEIDNIGRDGASFVVKGAPIPGSTVEPVEVPFMNRVVKIAGDRTFEDWNVTILADQTLSIRADIEGWLKDQSGHSNISGTSPSQYKRTMRVKPMDRNGNVVTTYTFHGAFPTTLDAIDLAWGTDGAPAEYGVTFSYDYWEVQ